MKTFILLIASVAMLNNSMAQSTNDILKQQAGEGVKEGATIATEHTADKVADKVLNSIFGKKKKKDKTPQSQDATPGNTNSNVQTNTASPNNVAVNNSPNASLQTYSKYDFVPGEKVLAFDDFSKDAIGDYPATWNTNSAGEVVKLSTRNGQWLMLNKDGKYVMDYIHSLPDNFTLEFDMVENANFNYYSAPLSLYCLSGKGGNTLFDNWFLQDGKRAGVQINLQPVSGMNNAGFGKILTYEGGDVVINNQVDIQGFNSNNNKSDLFTHIAIWRQKQRIRVYVNEKKVFDLPKAFAANTNYTSIMFQLFGGMKNQDQYMISNIKLAVGDPDTRNKLMNEGKFSTTGILFDVNSSTIKPESYGSLKAIADVLSENPSVRVKIIGNTDSDGDASANMTLSKKRADAVKAALVSQFGIDGSRLDTDGKGASNPVAPNTTSEGKAQNRRVDFIKM